MANNALVPANNQPPALRRGILARIFGPGDDQNAMERLRSDHALARLAIELDADLTRHRRKAHYFLEVTALEDRAIKEIVKAQKREEILDSIDELFDHDPLTAAVLKDRVRHIYNQHKPRKRHCRG
jgi:hypothetical protein